MKRVLMILAACLLLCLPLACAEASDARRTLALIVLGVLAVALLVLFGKPSAKKPEPAPEEPEETPDPVVIFEEEPKDTPERR